MQRPDPTYDIQGYTDAELQEALGSVDARKYPERAAALRAEAEQRSIAREARVRAAMATGGASPAAPAQAPARPASYPEPSPASPHGRLPPPRPASVEAEFTADGVVLKVRFSRLKGLAGLGGNLMFLAALGFLLSKDPKYVDVVRDLLAGALHGEQSLVMFFILAFGVSSIGGLYFTLVTLLNTTTIRLDWQTLSVRHAPLPWAGGRELARAGISQLYLEDSGVEGDSKLARLVAITRDGAQHVLLGKAHDLDTLRFLEHELEARLKLTDQPVVGELGR